MGMSADYLMKLAKEYETFKDLAYKQCLYYASTLAIEDLTILIKQMMKILEDRDQL